jgi:hypothetical protein
MKLAVKSEHAEKAAREYTAHLSALDDNGEDNLSLT